MKFKLGSKIISKESLPYIIAEVGVNHECSISKAKRLIFEAKKGGADSVKFQTYKANLLASKDSPAYWDTKKEKSKNQYELFKKYDAFTIKEYKVLFKYCKKLKIDFSSTPFDLDSVDELNPYLKFFKISSSDITNFPLLEKIAKKKKPILLSTGASNIYEIKQAVKFLKKRGCKKIVIMHCILSYPTKNDDANLAMIIDLKEKFPNDIIGYSDHTLPDNQMSKLVTSYILGSRVIEKHFTLNKRQKGNDHYHSMDKNDLILLIKKLDQTKKILGNNEKKVILAEKASRKFARRSLVANKDLYKNHILKPQDIVCKRPGTGISPKFLSKILKKKVLKNLKKDQIITWKHISRL
jgi:sialic acid synthase SpsE